MYYSYLDFYFYCIHFCHFYFCNFQCLWILIAYIDFVFRFLTPIFCLCFSGMKTTGTKIELLMRLQNSGNDVIEIPSKIINSDNNNDINNINTIDNNDSNVRIEYSKMTLKSLREICREKKLKMSGTKAEVIVRINQYDVENIVVNINNIDSNNIDSNNIDSNNIDSSSSSSSSSSSFDNDMKNYSLISHSVTESENDNNNENNNNENNSSKVEIVEKSAMYEIYNAMEKKDLVSACITRSLSPHGSKEQLIDTLIREDDIDSGEEVNEKALIQCYNEGLRAETPLYTIKPPASKYREIT